MSGRSDIRMYVEHLFEGRTLDAETIELKEEIYGNLVARFDDYVAQGMSEDEAYRRTCEAVTSVEDMLDEKDEPAVDATFVAPAPQPVAPEPPAAAADSVPAPATAQRKHWPTWAIVAVVVAGVLVAGMIVVTVFNVVNTDAARDARTSSEDSLVVTLEQPTDSTTGTGQQDGTGNRYGAPSQSETELLAEVQAHSPSELSVYAGTGLGDASRVEEIVRSLPVGGYVSAVTPDAGAGTLEIYYNYQDRDLLAHDDDHVDRALVYDVVALMSTIDGLDQVSLIETEPDDGSYDVDLRVFDRSMVEGVLGTALGPDLLTDDGWNALREQVLSERYCDPIWERAERD